MTTRPRRPGDRSRAATVVLGVVLVLGCSPLLTVGASSWPTPGEMIARRMAGAVDLLGLRDLAHLLYSRAFEVQLLVLAIAFLGIPLLALRRRDAPAEAPGGEAAAPAHPPVSAAGKAPTTAPVRTVRRRRGRLAPIDLDASTPVTRTVAQLQDLAAAAGIPWRDEFATPGGARALAELLGRTPGLEPSGGPQLSEDSGPDPDQDTRKGSGPGPELVLAASAADPGDPPEAGTGADAGDGTGDDEVATAPPAYPGASDFEIGSVYTPTTLYDSREEEP
ncbi:hypothetical protein [Brachybacterium hainanense]|uniref:Uncharacterized protein n=1 Tax=Brachybacterium hainanense TaxID=1541174 RepID=A0ABV6RE81_9MICO